MLLRRQGSTRPGATRGKTRRCMRRTYADARSGGWIRRQQGTPLGAEDPRRRPPARRRGDLMMTMDAYTRRIISWRARRSTKADDAAVGRRAGPRATSAAVTGHGGASSWWGPNRRLATRQLGPLARAAPRQTAGWERVNGARRTRLAQDPRADMHGMAWQWGALPFLLALFHTGPTRAARGLLFPGFLLLPIGRAALAAFTLSWTLTSTAKCSCSAASSQWLLPGMATGCYSSAVLLNLHWHWI